MSRDIATDKGIEPAEGAATETLSRISHDLRTPLNVVIGFAELMLDEVPGPINENQKQCLTDILEAGRRLLKIINSRLDVPQAGAGRD